MKSCTIRSPGLGRVLRAAAMAAAALAFAAAPPAQGGLVWNWTFGGSESGTFTTNGTYADSAGAFNFAITDFDVTSSVVAGLIGRPFTQSQPVQGFLWDGTSATQFYRDSGSLTNGSNFFVSVVGGSTYSFGFVKSPGGQQGRLFDPGTYTPVVNYSSLSLTPQSPTAVPEIDPAGMGSVAALVTGALGLLERRRRRVA